MSSTIFVCTYRPEIRHYVNFSLKMITATLLSEIDVILCICLACMYQHLISSQLEIDHVLNGTTPEKQHRKRGPWKGLS